MTAPQTDTSSDTNAAPPQAPPPAPEQPAPPPPDASEAAPPPGPEKTAAPAAPASEARVILPHMATEFYIWLWFITEAEGGSLVLNDKAAGHEVGPGVIDLWIDARIAMRDLDNKKTATFTAHNAPQSLSARAALGHGWMPTEIRFHGRREEREFTFTLSGSAIDLKTASLPQVLIEESDDAFFDRMMVLEELEWLIQALFVRWAKLRVHADWPKTLRRIRNWIATGVDGGEE